MKDLDLSGLKCPLPVLRTQKALRMLEGGSRLSIIVTDPMAAIDLPHFCSENGHQLIEMQQSETGALHFLIEKTR